jgi:hypothetical protein
MAATLSATLSAPLFAPLSAPSSPPQSRIRAPPTAFTALQDSFVFCSHGTAVFHNTTGPTLSPVISSAVLNELKGMKHRLAGIARLVEGADAASPLLVPLYGMVKALSVLERRRDPALVQPLCKLWVGAKDLHAVLKAFPAADAVFPTMEDPLAYDQKVMLGYMRHVTTLAIRSGSAPSVTLCLQMMADYATSLDARIPEIAFLAYKLRLLSAFATVSRSEWLSAYYASCPDALLSEINEILGVLGA